jgi:beta-carotene 15,15'-dioxygenase
MTAYMRSTLFKVQVVLQLLLVLLFAAVDVPANSQVLLCSILLSTVGIPHGANDYLYRKDQSAKGLALFVLKYLMIMVLYGLVWVFFSPFALLVFFVISFHHFGQSNFANRKMGYYPSLLWGVWVLVFPVLFHIEEAGAILNEMMQLPNDSIWHGAIMNAFKSTRYWILSVVGLLYVWSLYKFEYSTFKPYCIQFALVTAWYIYSPLLTGFIVVFCLWHAFQSLNDQAYFYITVRNNRPLKFYLFMVPFGVIALLVFGLLLTFFELSIGQLLMALSLITLPHVFVMNDLYHPHEIEG